LPWKCEGSLPHTPSHFLTRPGVCDVTPRLLLALIPGLHLALTLGLPIGPQPYNPFCLGHELKARVATLSPTRRRGQCPH